MKYSPSGVLLLAVVLVALAWFFFLPEAASETPAVQEERSEAFITTVATDLEVPWGIAFLPDGTLLVTERTGMLAHVDGGAISRIPVDGVASSGEGGLLGITLHPDFAENHFLYLYLTENTAAGTENRVVRFVYEDGVLRNATTIIEGIPGARFHDGGQLAFGPGGYLYITTGDAGNEALAQDTGSLAGKILRVGDEGSVPPDNPFGNAVYSYGHRNPQGLAWDGEGQLWATEHGRSGIRSGYDELNRIERGGNYGWPEIQGDETKEGMISPVLHSGASDTWAPASLAYRDGKLYWGGLRGEALYTASITGEGVRDLTEHFSGEYGRIRAAVFGPDGRLYLSTSNTDGRGDVHGGDDQIISVDARGF